MKNKITKFLLFIFITGINQSPLFSSEYRDNDIQKIDDNLYFAKIKNKDLFFIMERVTPDNIDSWKKYGEVQAKVREVMSFDEGMRKYGVNTFAGSGMFASVLRDPTTYINNELWVSYITSNPDVKHITSKDIQTYNVNEMIRKENQFAKSIQMFTTITSDFRAIISTHLGIAASVESLSQDRPRGLSIDLHFLSAKAMRIRNPRLRFMINAPVMAMRKILYDRVPKNALFADTREMAVEVKKASILTFENFKTENKKLIEKIHKDVNQAVNDELIKINNARSVILKLAESKNENEPNKIMDLLSNLIKNDSIAERLFDLNPDSTITISREKINNIISQCVDAEFKIAKNPFLIRYELISESERYYGVPFNFPNSVQNNIRHFADDMAFLTKLIEERPPILSVDEYFTIEDSLALYDPDDSNKVILKADRSMPQYEWMFKQKYKPIGMNPYIVIDLVRWLQQSK